MPPSKGKTASPKSPASAGSSTPTSQPGQKPPVSNQKKSIQSAIEAAEIDRKMQLLRMRVEVASTGVRAYTAHKIPEAVKAFESYLNIVEEWKGVKEGGLTPALFDQRKDVAELLLISGVYWDLVKLYDRTESSQKYKEFLHYLEKFILFTRGMPFEILCRETLRKYIAVEKTRHTEDFKNAYRVMGGGRCFVAGELVDLCDERTLPRLRLFRDGYLKRRAWGRGAIKLYYRHGPRIARVVRRLPRPLRQCLALGLDFVGGQCSPDRRSV